MQPSLFQDLYSQVLSTSFQFSRFHRLCFSISTTSLLIIDGTFSWCNVTIYLFKIIGIKVVLSKILKYVL